MTAKHNSSLWAFLVLAFALAVPFWVVGAMTRLQLLPVSLWPRTRRRSRSLIASQWAMIVCKEISNPCESRSKPGREAN